MVAKYEEPWEVVVAIRLRDSGSVMESVVAENALTVEEAHFLLRRAVEKAPRWRLLWARLQLAEKALQ